MGRKGYVLNFEDWTKRGDFDETESRDKTQFDVKVITPDNSFFSSLIPFLKKSDNIRMVYVEDFIEIPTGTFGNDQPIFILARGPAWEIIVEKIGKKYREISDSLRKAQKSVAQLQALDKITQSTIEAEKRLMCKECKLKKSMEEQNNND